MNWITPCQTESQSKAYLIKLIQFLLHSSCSSKDTAVLLSIRQIWWVYVCVC